MFFTAFMSLTRDCNRVVLAPERFGITLRRYVVSLKIWYPDR
jgi:hypothetical protein